MIFLQPGLVDLATLPDGEEPFLPPEEQAALDKTLRDERVRKQADWYSEQTEGAALARREREEAEIGGHLSPDAEAFRELRLKPRIAEAHTYEPVVRKPVVQGLFFQNSLTWVAGTSGTFKSFITADLAFRYGTEDMDYHGKRMTHGRALVVVAEGAAGYADRKTAWEKQHDREVKNVSIYPAPIQLGDTLKEIPALISYLKEEDEAGRPVTLIIFDTQAMCTVGIEENNSEMNLVINVLHRIREVSAACVMVVHHFGKNKAQGMRGSSMIYAAADTVCVLKRDDDEMTVKLSTSQADEGKQKDAITERDLLELELRPHAVGEDYFGDAVYSLVPLSYDAPAIVAPEPEEVVLPHIRPILMYYLRGLGTYEQDGCTPSYLAGRLAEPEYGEAPPEGHKVTRTSPGNALQELKKKHLAEPVPGRKGAYRISPLGFGVIAREISDRAQTEASWVSRRSRRGPVRGVSSSQFTMDPETP